MSAATHQDKCDFGDKQFENIQNTQEIAVESNCSNQPMKFLYNSRRNENYDKYILLYDGEKTCANGLNREKIKCNHNRERNQKPIRLNAVIIGEPMLISDDEDDEDNCDDYRTQNTHIQISNGMKALIAQMLCNAR